MNKEVNLNIISKRYELVPTSGGKGIIIPNKKRIIVGRSNTADIELKHQDISSIHCVIEINNDHFVVFDMNSYNGTFYNGEKIIKQAVPIGGAIQIGGHHYILKEFRKEDVLPPILAGLDPGISNPQEVLDVPVIPVETEESTPKPPTAPSSISSKEVKPPVAPKKFDATAADDSDIIPRVEYPLEKDPKAEFSEYIFEDVETLYPIFNYEPSRSSVEVIILFKDRIYSVDYLPQKNGVFNLVGKSSAGPDIEYPYLPQSEKFGFVEIKGGDVFISPLDGYKFMCLGDSAKPLSSSIELDHDDIFCFINGDIEIYVRSTEIPPKVKPAPSFSKDKEFKKYIAFMLLLFSLVTAGMSLFEVDKELEKEKAPKRMATILYKKPVFKKALNTPSKKVATPKVVKVKKVEKKPAVKPTKKVTKAQTKPKAPKKAGKKVVTTKTPKKAAPVRAKTNRVKVVKSPKSSTRKSVTSKRAGATRKANVKASSKGHVDTYKALDFSSSMNSLLAKGGSISNVKVAKASNSAVGTTGVSGSRSAQYEQADVPSKTGSLSGSATGTLDTSTGTEGLADSKGSVATIGLPNRIDVIGSIDGDVILQLLRDHLPQFRSCYQRVLRPNSVFSGVVKLNFAIGASGRATRVAATNSKVPRQVRTCIAGVVKGIQFPEPNGGGIVEVSQPLNLIPNLK